jgi:hypothetical protein
MQSGVVLLGLYAPEKHKGYPKDRKPEWLPEIYNVGGAGWRCACCGHMVLREEMKQLGLQGPPQFKCAVCEVE